ncbi:MAG: GNAT family N-acetyltransferase [Deltaproteobacteria bacterium]|nr:GNAT family N-acetyltransferase [Deltaproteobacteria bacterium]
MKNYSADIEKCKESLVYFRSRRLFFKQMVEEDITDEYLAWLNDPEVTRFLEIRFSQQSRENVIDYIRKSLSKENKTLHLGVFDKEGGRLIGTVTFHDIDEHHRSACISFVIGHPDARGKGYGSEAVHAATHYMFKVRGFVKLWGGYYEGHAASERVFLKNGYQIEGRLKGKLVNFSGERVDHILMGLLAEDFKPNPKILRGTEER